MPKVKKVRLVSRKRPLSPVDSSDDDDIKPTVKVLGKVSLYNSFQEIDKKIDNLSGMVQNMYAMIQQLMEILNQKSEEHGTGDLKLGQSILQSPLKTPEEVHSLDEALTDDGTFNAVVSYLLTKAHPQKHLSVKHMLEVILHPILQHSFTAKGTANKASFFDFKNIKLAITQANGSGLTDDDYVKGAALFFKMSAASLNKTT